MKPPGAPPPAGILEIMRSIAARLGHRLYHAEIRSSTLQVLIEGKSANTLDACAKFSRLLSSELDNTDVPWDRYTLEVSTPGIEKPLYSPEHFNQAVGQEVHVVSRDGTLDGTLATTGKTSIVVDAGGENATDRIKIDYARIKYAHVKVSSTELFGGGGTGLKDE